MFLVDTNILVYAANSGSSEHAVCFRLLERLRRESLPWYSTWGILYEFLRVVTHPRVFSKPWTIREAWGFVNALLDSPGLTVLTATDRHSEVARQVFDAIPEIRGNLVHDAHTATLMREHGIRRIYTRDMDFHRFTFVEVVDPLISAGGE